MSKRFVTVLFLGVVMTALSAARSSAEEKPPSVSLRLDGIELAAKNDWSLRRAADRAPHLASADEAGAQKAAKKKDGRKAMWITIAASAVGVALAMKFAPEAEIPTTPSYGAYKCTMFYRPGGLVTTSGYTCVPR
jgi:hypothetical protein